MQMLEAIVMNNIDPQSLGRLLITIPGHTGVGIVHWARACLPGRSFQLPAIGEHVWVVKLHPDGKEFVWMGHAPFIGVGNYTQNIAERNGTAPVIVIQKPTKSNQKTSAVEQKRSAAEQTANPKPSTTPTRHTVSKTPGGITFFADDDILNKRFETVKDPVELRKKMHALLTKKDDFIWGIEDPLGNHIVLEHFNGNTYLTFAMLESDPEKRMALVFNSETKEFSLSGTDFEISHNGKEHSFVIKDDEKNSVLLKDGKVTLTGEDGKGGVYVSKDGTDEPVPLGDKLKTILDALYDAITDPAVVAGVPYPADTFAVALKAALTTFATTYAPYKTGTQSYLAEA